MTKHTREIKSQGLFFYEGVLYESGGQYSLSKIMKRNLNVHEYSIGQFAHNSDEHFAEGADYYINSAGELFIIQLTWQDRKIVKYDKDLKLVQEIDLDKRIREGWGLTHDPASKAIYYISDGSSNIYECDAEQGFKVVAVHPVT